MDTELDTLQTVMGKTADLIDGVRPDQLSTGTPCPDWDVSRLITHLVGWADNFADRAEGSTPAAEPDATDPGQDPAGRLRAAAQRLVTALSGDGEPAENSPSVPMLVAEYVLHGWDLAIATGQPVPFTDEEAAPGLAELSKILEPKYRGFGFEAEVTVPDDAPVVDKLLAFSGRQP